jgi:hypothetical protein
LALAKILPVAAPLLALYIARALCSHNKSGHQAFQNIIGNHGTFAKNFRKSAQRMACNFCDDAGVLRDAWICRSAAKAC